MKHALFLVILALSATTALSQQRVNVTMNVDSVDRYFIVVRPSGTMPAAGYPLVFMFHGTSGDGEKFYNISGWKEKAQQETFIAVFPSSLEYCIEEDGSRHRTTKWNNGDLQSVACPGQNIRDDVFFVRRMIDTIAAMVQIDRSRIYASGFSNGGVFTSKLAVEMSDVFAALTASAGPLDELDSATAARNIPFMFTIGLNDDRLLTAAGVTSIPFNDTAFRYMRSIIVRYLGAFRMGSTFESTSTPMTITQTYTTLLASGAQPYFSATFVKDLDHQYPNGSNHPLVAANIFWEFYRRSALSSIVPERGTSTRVVTIAPNPARGRVRVGGSGGERIALHSVLGVMVFEGVVGDDGIVTLPGIASGSYFVSVGTKAPVMLVVE